MVSHLPGVMRPAHLNAPSYCVGELHSIDELAVGADLGREMRSVGLSTFAVFDDHPMEMAKNAVHKTLSSARISSADIDAVIYATTAYAKIGITWSLLDIGSDVANFCQQSGLHQAVPMSVSLNQCANMSAAISMAASLVSAGRYDNVLIVAADRIPDGVSRVVHPGTTVLSDSAASCLVSTECAGWEIVATAEQVDASAWLMDPARDFYAYLNQMTNGIAAVCTRLYQQAGVTADGFDRLLVNNVNQTTSRLFAQFSGVAMEAVHTTNIARYGHCDTADLVINLADHSPSGTPPAGEMVLMLALAPFLRRAIALRGTGR